jgi:hypothetical protein
MTHDRTYFTVQFWNNDDTWVYNYGDNRVAEFDSKLEAEETIKRIFRLDPSIFSAKIFRVSKDEEVHMDNDV